MGKIKSIGSNAWERLWALILVFASAVSEGFLELFDSFEPRDGRHHHAAFGTDRKFINETNTGFVVNGTERIPRTASFEGMLVTGATGSGKGVNIIIPNILKLLDGRTSLCIHDPNGDSYRRTSGYAQHRGYEVVAYRWDDPSSSDFYNPFDQLRSNSHAFALAEVLADSHEDRSSSDPFWKLQGTVVLYMGIAICMKLAPEFRTLKNVRHLLIQFSIDPRRLERLFIAHADDDLMETFMQVYSMEDKVLRNVVSSALAYLSLWSDDNVAVATSQSSFDFSTLRSGRPKCIYILNSVTDTKLRPLVNVFFSQLSANLLSRIPGPHEHDVMMVMDEMSSVTISNLHILLMNSRKHFLGWIVAFQSTSTIRACHPHHWEGIMGNLRTKVYLGGMGLESSKHLEELIGREDVSDGKGGVRTQYLMTQEALRAMPPETGIVISPVGTCYKVAMRPYFEDPFLNRKAQKAPVRVSRPLPPVHLTKIDAVKEK